MGRARGGVSAVADANFAAAVGVRRGGRRPDRLGERGVITAAQVAGLCERALTDEEIDVLVRLVEEHGVEQNVLDIIGGQVEGYGRSDGKPGPPSDFVSYRSPMADVIEAVASAVLRSEFEAGETGAQVLSDLYGVPRDVWAEKARNAQDAVSQMQSTVLQSGTVLQSAVGMLIRQHERALPLADLQAYARQGVRRQFAVTLNAQAAIDPSCILTSVFDKTRLTELRQGDPPPSLSVEQVLATHPEFDQRLFGSSAWEEITRRALDGMDGVSDSPAAAALAEVIEDVYRRRRLAVEEAVRQQTEHPQHADEEELERVSAARAAAVAAGDMDRAEDLLDSEQMLVAQLAGARKRAVRAAS